MFQAIIIIHILLHHLQTILGTTDSAEILFIPLSTNLMLWIDVLPQAGRGIRWKVTFATFVSAFTASAKIIIITMNRISYVSLVLVQIKDYSRTYLHIKGQTEYEGNICHTHWTIGSRKHRRKKSEVRIYKIKKAPRKKDSRNHADDHAIEKI